MGSVRRYNFSMILIFLCLIFVFASTYNASVKAAVSDVIENNKVYLQKKNTEIIAELTKAPSTKHWQAIIDDCDDILITVFDSSNNVVAESQTNLTRSFDVQQRSAFEYQGNAYLIQGAVFILHDFAADSMDYVRFIFIEFLIAIVALFLIGSVIYTAMLRPYREFYRSIEEYEKTGNFRENRFGGNIGKIYDRFGAMIQNLEREQQNQRRIIASISHDIKTPLTSIMGYAERLKNDNIPEERRKRYLNTVYDKSVQIRELVDEFDEYLSYNMAQSLKLESVSAQSICERVELEYADELENLSVKFEAENFAGNAEVSADKAKLMRVFGNIISNSLKHFKEESEKRIRFTVEDKKSYVLIKIQDNGTGVESEKLEMIFEPLYTSDKGRKVAGLGLAICREIVESHGGKIYAAPSELGGLGIFIELEKI